MSVDPSGEQSASSRTRLKGNTIGPWGLAALAIGITSPALGLYALWGTMQATAGPITPLIFIAAMILTLPTGISYALLNRRAPSAGAASTWLWITVSRTAGYQAGCGSQKSFNHGLHRWARMRERLFLISVNSVVNPENSSHRRGRREPQRNTGKNGGIDQ